MERFGAMREWVRHRLRRIDEASEAPATPFASRVTFPPKDRPSASHK